MVSVACEDSTSDLKTFRFGIKDSDGIDGATLYYKDSRAIIFQEMALAYSADNDTWVVEFRANERDYDMLVYYLRVTDGKGATVRHPGEGTLSTEACRIHYVDNDTSVTDTVPDDSVPPSPRDSVVYSLIADTAEIYDKDLDGRADFVRVHFKEEREDNITSIDSIFWNSNRGEWRYVPADAIKQSRTDGKWFEGYIDKPYRYGLTKADSAHPPFLSFTTIHSDELENVKLLDRVGAVPAKASKFPGRVGLKEYMEPDAEMPPDTLIVRMSEPVSNAGGEMAWERLFRYSASCKDTVSQPLKLRSAPTVRENGQVWTLILDGYSVKAGACLFADPSSSYIDLAGNAMGRGGIEIDGRVDSAGRKRVGKSARFVVRNQRESKHAVQGRGLHLRRDRDLRDRFSPEIRLRRRNGPVGPRQAGRTLPAGLSALEQTLREGPTCGYGRLHLENPVHVRRWPQGNPYHKDGGLSPRE